MARPKKWTGCYDDSWKGVITDQSFVHPAKMARGLLTRIITHGFSRGYWKQEDIIGDCFGGIGTTGIIGAYHRLKVVCVELEPKFVSLARRNFFLHQSKWKSLGVPRPVMLQGDSRRFDELVSGLDGIVGSPPFQTRTDGSGIAVSGETTTNILGRSIMVDAILSSPPYADSVRGQESGIDQSKVQRKGGPSGKSLINNDYGTSPEQIGRLKEGELDGVIASPPWQNNCEGHMKASKFSDPSKALSAKRGHGCSDSARLAQVQRDEQKTYGNSPGQIALEKPESYWHAVSLVYQACFRSLKPGGVLCLVVKDYVKNKKIVPLCSQTVRLLSHLGFKPLERIRALLKEETIHADLFTGATKTVKSRKSFFRRLAENKGSPPIDHEEVLFFRKP